MSNYNLKLQTLTEKHFGFLESEYGYTFNKETNSYFTEVLEISVSADQIGPFISCWIKSEPSFTKLNFRYFVICAEKKNLLNSSFFKDDYEENFVYTSQLLFKCLSNITNNGVVLLVCALKLFYEDSLAVTRMTINELNKTDQAYKLIHAYVSKKEPDWVPKHQLIDF